MWVVFSLKDLYIPRWPFIRFYKITSEIALDSGRKKANRHKLFALVSVQMALGQTAGCPRVNLCVFAWKHRNIQFPLWLAGGLSQGCPVFQKVYVFKVDVPFSCPIDSEFARCFLRFLKAKSSLARLVSVVLP